MEFKQTQLDNGLTIIAEANPLAASLAAGFFVRAGSRDESPEVSGVSHFLEHMVFKGTPNRAGADVNRELDEIGAKYNASTSSEDTVYFAGVLPEFQTAMLDVLCDIMRPSLRKEDFDTEKDVILEEIAMLDDAPGFRVFEALLSLHFDGHPLGNKVRGTTESIRRLTRKQMQEYFERRYSPGNITVVGVGNIDYGRFVDRISELCSRWKTYPGKRETPHAQTTPRQKIITDKNVSRGHIGLISPAPDHQDPQRYAADLLAAIIGDVTGSRLYYALIDPAIADQASTSYQPLDGAGGFLTFVSTDTERVGKALEITQSELRKLLDGGPTETELLTAKNKIASSVTLDGELPMGRLRVVGLDWVHRGEYLPLTEQIEALFAVTIEQVQQVARQYDLAATTAVVLGPMESL